MSLVHRTGLGDRAAGIRCLEQARSHYEECEAAWELARVRGLLKGVG